ncbi:MAG: hypothetical protein CO113_03150 [Elusimicrobia bacterium CG_4_9_14_3_um_filter_62_55]|nr:MAG: hypothetical protein COR54_08280 [Elusimicrobia bacterium CG22_combo_CG10-13_8_21_14_all_63_91]PJA15595.1 MAG: hypothetical protein COX66_09760 [Elusimicrobia bacterium CG_4_10_14_0_2_um_filter_63_34]PJB26528.1 MAG: hypothetical protein CO113_03150 [Elusimicrobia bacterium CG_4_9_14_3_um_filter_62_55]
MNEREAEEESGAGRFAALLVVCAMGVAAVVAAWILMAPQKRASAPVAEGGSVFDEARAGDELRDQLYNLQDTRAPRKSPFEILPEPEADSDEFRAVPKKTPAPASSERGGATWKLMKKAEDAFFRMKNSKRFKDSKSLNAVKRDFLADPALRGVNERYYTKHRNPVRFVVETVKSPAFGSVAKKHIAESDVAAFVHSMMSSSSVMRAAKAVTQEFSLKPYIDALPIPGLGSLGAINAKGKGLTAPPSSAQTLKMMNLDPKLLELEKQLKSPKR